MIIQGSNQPIVITFDVAVSEFKDYSVCLVAGGEVLKSWRKGSSDITVDADGYKISCKMTQAETFSFPVGICRIEIKWSNSSGTIYHTEAIYDAISERFDKTALGVS